MNAGLMFARGVDCDGKKILIFKTKVIFLPSSFPDLLEDVILIPIVYQVVHPRILQCGQHEEEFNLLRGAAVQRRYDRLLFLCTYSN